MFGVKKVTNKLIIANLKMNMDVVDTSRYLKVINENIVDNNVIICPTSIYIPYFLKKSYQVGIQNVFYEDKGAYTGEISPKQAKSMGINYVMVGHSERRRFFNETDTVINKKIKACLKNNLKVILCIGETKEEYDMLKTNKVLKKQIIRALNDIKGDILKNIIIAYEPEWAIGSNIIPNNKEIEDTIRFIRAIVIDNFNYQDIKVLYGGGINDININKLNTINNIDGFLIGDASIDAYKLLSIISVIRNG